MTLSSEAKRCLQIWLGQESWDSGHPLDLRRFYDFVNQYAVDGGVELSTEDLVSEAARSFGFEANDFKRGNLEGYVDRANHILDFLSYTRGRS